MRNHEDITTAVYRKESSSDVYLHWDSFTPVSLKRGILRTLVGITSHLLNPKITEKGTKSY